MLGLIETKKYEWPSLLHFVEQGEEHAKAILQQAKLDNPISPSLKARWHSLTEAQFDALLASQGNRCAICFLFRRLGVNKDKNGHVRGLLCRGCNILLGLLSQDIVGMLDRVDYHLIYGVRDARSVLDHVLFRRKEQLICERAAQEESIHERPPWEVWSLKDEAEDSTPH